MPSHPEPRSVALEAFARPLGLRPREVSRGILLFTYLFLIVSSFIAGKAARDALFLARFGALHLPYVDIAVALLVGVWIWGYLRAGRFISLRRLVSASLLFFASNALLFWYLSKYADAAWVLPIVYVWVGVFGVVAPAQVWTLANYVLTTREAKRLFAFVGSGAILGAIAGGFVIRRTAVRFGAESTLLGIALALLACVIVADQLWRRRHLAHGVIDEDDEEPATSKVGPVGLRASLRLIAQSPYLSSIAAVICLSSFVTAVAAWQFKATSSRHFTDPDRLAAFFGGFNFYAGILAFVLQLVLTSRLLRRFGIGFALFIVPVALVLGSAAFLVLGTLAAAVFLRGTDQVLRYSIDRPTVELLYLPVPTDQTFQVKSFIDTVVWRLGDGLSGLTVLLFAAALGWSPVQLTWVNLLLLAGWLTAAWVARRQYVLNLSESIQQYRLDAERANAAVLDKTTTEVLASQLTGDDPKRILYALHLFSLAHHKAAHPAVHRLLQHASAEVRRTAVGLLDAANDTSVRSDVERLLYDADLSVRTEALLYLAHHAHVDPLERIEQLGNFQDFSIRSAMVSFLARPGATQNLDAAHLLLQQMVRDPDVRTRSEAARLLETLPDHFEQELAELLESDEPDVLRHALHAAGRSKKAAYVPRLIDHLETDSLREDATAALSLYGNRVVPLLRSAVENPHSPLAIRRAVPAVLLQIGTLDAEAALMENLLDADTVLRFNILSALNKLRAAGSPRPLDTRLVETVLAAEIMGHLRSYQIVGTLPAAVETGETVHEALQRSMSQEIERIFRLLKLLFPSVEFHSAYFGVQSDNRKVHDDALEYLENVLKPPLRALIVPLLDKEVSAAQRIELADQVLGTQVETREEAVELLALSPDPWLKSCAAYAIGVLGLTRLAANLEQWASDEDPVLRETARQAKVRLRTTSA
jgi:ATP:ADP antiporter, AAA family